jgi:hypothetical protein
LSILEVSIPYTEFGLKRLFYLALYCWNLTMAESYPDAANIFSAITGTSSAAATAAAEPATAEPATAAAKSAANATGIDILPNPWNLSSILES